MSLSDWCFLWIFFIDSCPNCFDELSREREKRIEIFVDFSLIFYLPSPSSVFFSFPLEISFLLFSSHFLPPKRNDFSPKKLISILFYSPSLHLSKHPLAFENDGLSYESKNLSWLAFNLFHRRERNKKKTFFYLNYFFFQIVFSGIGFFFYYSSFLSAIFSLRLGFCFWSFEFNLWIFFRGHFPFSFLSFAYIFYKPFIYFTVFYCLLLPFIIVFCVYKKTKL